MRKSIYLVIFWIGFVGAIATPSSAFADSLGEQALFRVDANFDVKERKELFASLRLISDQLYFYVEDDWWGQLDTKQRDEFMEQAQRLATSFETEIYPSLTSIFGKENRPGIDGDTHITIVVHRMRDHLKGYFNTGDGYSKLESPGSNEREMVYLSDQTMGSELAASYLAHEFMHLVYFHQKQITHNTREEVWIQEGFAELAPTLVGYDNIYEGSYLERRVRDFLSGPRDSLVEWRGLRADYGVVNVFFQYLLDQYGQALLQEALESPQGGIASFETALQNLQTGKTFSDVFADWMIAVFLNDCSYGNQYCFQRENLSDIRIAPFTNFLSSFGEVQLTVTNETKNWAGNWHKISGGKGTLEVLFDGNPHAQFVVPYLVQNASGAYEIGAFALGAEQRGTITVLQFGLESQAVIILPLAHHEKSGFDERNPSYFFSWTVSTDSGNGTSAASSDSNEESAESGNPSTPSPEIAALLSQIAQLRAQIASLQLQLGIAVAPDDTPSGGISCTFQENLSFGLAQSDQVRCLQEFLKAQDGVYPAQLVTGNFLHFTRQAVTRFQEKYAAEILEPLGLQQGTGYVGPATRKKIQELMREQQLVLTSSLGGV